MEKIVAARQVRLRLTLGGQVGDGHARDAVRTDIQR
jgi:hypothetical protein